MLAQLPTPGCRDRRYAMLSGDGIVFGGWPLPSKGVSQSGMPAQNFAGVAQTNAVRSGLVLPCMAARPNDGAHWPELIRTPPLGHQEDHQPEGKCPKHVRGPGHVGHHPMRRQ